MKSTHVVFKRLIIALALTTQLFLFAAPTQAAPSASTSNVTQDNVNHADHNSMRPSRGNRRCRERCAWQYRQCRRGVANPNQARCRQRYNQCLRRCRR